MAEPSLGQHVFLHLFSLLMTTKVFGGVALDPRSDIPLLLCRNPGQQYVRHPLDCSRWFRCSSGQPVEMPACIDGTTFSTTSFTCLPRRNENNDCDSTCIFNGKIRYLGETFGGRNPCERCVCQNNTGSVVCSNVCLSRGATCSFEGRTYQVGQYFMYADGCNTCLCEEGGLIGCTDIKCQTNKVTCYHRETVYVAGETFPHLADGQHTCTCRLDGVVSCSTSHAEQTEDEMRCQYDQKRRRAGTVFLSVDHCNQCECLDTGNVTCTKFNCSSQKSPLKKYKVINPVTPTANVVAASSTAQTTVRCQYEKMEYMPGDTFTATDGCSSCSCSHTGKVHCTKKICSQPRVSYANRHRSCFYAGQRYQFHDTFNSTDGCNTCYCTRHGRVQCTELACLPIWNETQDQFTCVYGRKEYKEGESFFAMDGCNYCTCDNYGQVQCTEKDCQFLTDTTTTTTKPTMATTLMSVTTTAQPSRPANTCPYKGKLYKFGETFSTPCDFCYCSLDGNVHCIRLTCPPESEMVSQHSPSEQFQRNTTTMTASTVSVNGALTSSNDDVSTKATNSNILKLLGIDYPTSVTEPNTKRANRSLITTTLATTETPLTPDQRVTLETSTIVSKLNHLRHSTHKSLLVSAAKNTTSHKNVSSTATNSAVSSQSSIGIKNSTLLWNFDSHNTTLDPFSLFRRPNKSKKKIPSSSESEIPLSNLISLSVLNFTTEAIKSPTHEKTDYFKFISTKIPKTQRPPSTEIPGFTTPESVSSIDTLTSEIDKEKGVIADLDNAAKAIGNSTKYTNLATHSFGRASGQNVATMPTIFSTITNPSMTVQNKSNGFTILPHLSTISADETFNSKSSPKNRAENPSLSLEVTTNSIPNLSNEINSTIKSSSTPYLMITTTTEAFPDITTQHEPLSLSNVINTPSTFSNQSPTPSTSHLTRSPPVTITTPPGIRVMPLFKNSNKTYFPRVNTSNIFKPLNSKLPVSERSTEASPTKVLKVTFSDSTESFPRSSTAERTQDRNQKSATSLDPTLESSTLTSFGSTTETVTPSSNYVHLTESTEPQTIHVSTTTDVTGNISVQPSTFISNVLPATPATVVESTTPDSTIKNAANSFNISTNSPLLSSASTTKSLTTYNPVSYVAEHNTLITPTANEAKPFPPGRRYEVTSLPVTRETISNSSASDRIAQPFNQYIRTTKSTTNLETNTPKYYTSKRISFRSNTVTSTAHIARPISMIPTITSNIPFLELSVTDSKIFPKTIPKIFKAIQTTTANIAVSKSSIPSSKTHKSMFSPSTSNPILSSTKPISLTMVSKKSPSVPDSDSCNYNGRNYQIWDIFMSQDECNTCECLYNGMVHCTEFPCHNQIERVRSTTPIQTVTPHIATTTKNFPTTLAQLEAVPCFYNGLQYTLWDIFPSFDGCNTCDCLYNGFVHCSDHPCVHHDNDIPVEKEDYSPILNPETCRHKGQMYEIGQTFLSEDKCTICNCTAGGLINCTGIHCPSENIQRNDIPVEKEDYSPMLNPETCRHKGQMYEIGQTFLSEDKCTICNCTVGGLINCTGIHCPSENIQRNDRKSKLHDKVSPKPKNVSRSPPIVTVALKTQTTTPRTTTTTSAPIVVIRTLCWYDGLSYQSGETFNSEDNCNTCTCMPDSLLTCTQLPCLDALSDQSTCTYNGHVYQNGQMFNSADGCNTCGCLDGGAILCTSQVCRLGKDKFKVSIESISPKKCSYNGQTYNAGDVFNSTDNCNLCNCTEEGRVKCMEKACRREPERLQYDEPVDVPVHITCSFEGRPYKPTQVIQMADGCNVCTCADDGRINCTDHKCLQNNNETRGSPSSLAPFTSTTTTTTTTTTATTSLPPNFPLPEFCTYDGHTFQAGDVFRANDGCNSCNCTIEGEVKCSRKRCPLNIASQLNVVADSLSLHVGVTCVYEGQMHRPRQVFPSFDGCNTCRCSEAGRIHCTDRVCPAKSNQSKALAQLAAKTTSPSHVPVLKRCSYNRQSYRVGEAFQSSDGCNLCNCSHNGVVKCGRRSCIPRNEEALRDVAMSLSGKVGVTCFYDGHVYQPEKVFPSSDGCNTCACSDKGQIHCTEAECSDRKPPKDSPQMTKAATPTPQMTRPKKTTCRYNGHSYVSGRIFKAADNCNMCGCLKNGNIHCTKNICDSKIVSTTVVPSTSAAPNNIPLVKCHYFGQKYNVGQMFDVQDGCNMCACLAEGTVRCTTQRCDPPVVFCKHGGHAYFIGQAFADECNTCNCGVHGIITCTELNCGTEDESRCQYNGEEHDQGETFLSSDGCHWCSCSNNARISCRPVPCQISRNRFDTSRERSEEEYIDD